MSNDNDAPAIPINGPNPKDLECRIRDDGTTVEQWSKWAGMWDLAYHAAGPNDARRYVFEHSDPDSTADYTVAGLRRQIGAIGVFEPFTFEAKDAASVEAAAGLAVEASYAGGFEHVHVRAVIRVEPEDEIGQLADAYWRARREPGGTVADEKGNLVDTGPEPKRIWEEMGTVRDRVQMHRIATLERMGLRPEVTKLVIPDRQPQVRDDLSVSWIGYAGSDDTGYAVYKHLRAARFTEMEEAETGARWVMVDGDRTIITYCEGDLSGQVFFTPEAYAAGVKSAREFYLEH